MKVCSRKACPHGGQPQPVSRFHADKTNADGLRGNCITCGVADAARWNKANPTKRKVTCRAYELRYREGYPGLTNVRARALRYSYGLSPDDYLALFNIQLGKCAVCDRDLNTLWLNDVDHCHLTGRVAGLLHRNCNTAIGLLGECSHTLNRAAAYVSARKAAAT
jgi:hypothetical protein